MTLLLADPRETKSAAISQWPRLRCPVCTQEMPGLPLPGNNAHSHSALCGNCGFEIQCESGIWNALPPDRERYYARFIAEYEHIRSQEGRGSSDSAYYLALPFRDVSGRNSQQWQIRARTFRYLERRILPGLGRQLGRPLDVLDLGAGNGWLSYRMSLTGHRAAAVDLMVNPEDGLGAARHYLDCLRAPFPCFRAELDRLPFGNGQFDCTIFNASLHYSEDYERTLREAFRCVRPDGCVIVADTAWYHKCESGTEMLRERRSAFLRRYGFASDALKSEEFLTDDRLQSLARTLRIQWEIYRPWYGLRWAMRPWIARWNKRREPSRFQIYVAKRCS